MRVRFTNAGKSKKISEWNNKLRTIYIIVKSTKFTPSNFDNFKIIPFLVKKF
ncbi:hypothetical protein J2W55_002942 [Mucilaginibacter pocheonensis]|uniref:Uncharacterized protein n=1 Tax=Mucilaginibacter pocheonensis TaxID=398050 RepID=A0ABU1TCG3_9SPHI|nr:hypothetical protein [Mucilaginibacter pocheonensis]